MNSHIAIVRTFVVSHLSKAASTEYKKKSQIKTTKDINQYLILEISI